MNLNKQVRKMNTQLSNHTHFTKRSPSPLQKFSNLKLRTASTAERATRTGQHSISDRNISEFNMPEAKSVNSIDSIEKGGRVSFWALKNKMKALQRIDLFSEFVLGARMTIQRYMERKKSVIHRKISQRISTNQKRKYDEKPTFKMVSMALFEDEHLQSLRVIEKQLHEVGEQYQVLRQRIQRIRGGISEKMLQETRQKISFIEGLCRQALQLARQYESLY